MYIQSKHKINRTFCRTSCNTFAVSACPFHLLLMQFLCLLGNFRTWFGDWKIHWFIVFRRSTRGVNVLTFRVPAVEYMCSFINAEAPGCRLGLRKALSKIRGFCPPYFAMYLAAWSPSWWRCVINLTKTHSWLNAIAGRMSSQHEYFPVCPLLKVHTHPERQRPGMVTLFEDQRMSSYFFVPAFSISAFLLSLRKIWSWTSLECKWEFLEFVSEVDQRQERGVRKVQILQELKLSPSNQQARRTK